MSQTGLPVYLPKKIKPFFYGLFIVGIIGFLTLMLLTANNPNLDTKIPIILLTPFCFSIMLSVLLGFYQEFIAKPKLLKQLIDTLHLNGHETVLSIRCLRTRLARGLKKHINNGKVLNFKLPQSGNPYGGYSKTIDLPFADQSVDAVASFFALHFVDEGSHRQTLFKEIDRVLKPGGRLVITDDDLVESYEEGFKALGWDDLRIEICNGLGVPIKMLVGRKPSLY